MPEIWLSLVTKIPPAPGRRPAPTHPDQVVLRGCEYCFGTLTWDICLEEWSCVRCGWREYENGRKLNGSLC